jgi:hypothetical protein
MKLPCEYMDNTFIMICCGSEDGLVANSRTYNKQLVDKEYELHIMKLPAYMALMSGKTDCTSQRVFSENLLVQPN